MIGPAHAAIDACALNINIVVITKPRNIFIPSSLVVCILTTIFGPTHKYCESDLLPITAVLVLQRKCSQSAQQLGSFFRFKDKIEQGLRSNLIYQYKCSECNSDYVGHTTRHLRSRIAEHCLVSDRTGKATASSLKKDSAVSRHFLRYRHETKEEDFKVLHATRDQNLITILEAIYIQKLDPKLNGKGAYPLQIYPLTRPSLVPV